MRSWSLRRILIASLLVFALVPAALVAWLMARSNTQAVSELARKIVSDVAVRVQNDTQSQLGEAHLVMNGLFQPQLSAAQTVQARRWLQEPARFEAMAFALTRQTPDVPYMYLGTHTGNYFGVQSTAQGVQVAIREGDDSGRRYFLAAEPGDRSRPLPSEAVNYEPRTRAWYESALSAKGRVFSPVFIAPDGRQLAITLSQSVFLESSAVAGVFAADLYLQRLADLLRVQHISAHGAAYLVDEQGFLVATSAGDELVRMEDGKPVRAGPAQSNSPVIRASFLALAADLFRKTDDTVHRATVVQRLPMGDDALIAIQRPFGDEFGVRWNLVVAAPEGDFTGDIQRALLVSLAVMTGLVLLAGLVAYYVAHRIGRQLEKLGTAAEQLGRGEIPAIEADTRFHEVRQLSRVMHDSAGQLQAYRNDALAHAQALRQANETLEERVALRTTELAASREEALGAARAKAAFLATMSHEIRTPLNGVVGMTSLLAESPLDDEQRDYLQTIQISSDQLLAVINDILDFSKIESGKLELEAEPLSLRGAIEEACDIAAPRAREKGLELIVDLPGQVPVALLGDVTRIRQVLINLINNAIKFTEHGEVTVTARQRGAADAAGRVVTEFRVTDTGIGIPADRVGSLFQAFTQVDVSTTRKYGGTGLGLAICKRLVELMGGEIGVQSVEGKGSTFWFTIATPLAELAPPGVHPQADVLNNRRVLVVDDNATNVRILTRQLQQWGMQVASAESGARALHDLQAGRPDVVITDMHMPGMDGVGFARALKSQAELADVPLLLLSSGFMPAGDDNAHLFKARLLKPVRHTQLFDTLVRCLSVDAARAAVVISEAGNERKNITVLVADDNPVNLKVVCAMCARLGYDTETAINGREAVDAVTRRAGTASGIGAVLMDVHMPQMDGLQATRAIVSGHGALAPPVIALTASSSPEDRSRCEAAGMVDYLTKPLQVSALARTLTRWAQPARDALPAVPAGPLTSRAPLQRTTEGAQPLVDPQRMEELKEFDDDALSLTRELMGLFKRDAPARLQDLDAALSAGDAGALARAAHALKGAAANIGAAALQNASAELEDLAAAGAMPADAAERLVKLHALWSKTEQAIKNWE